jgi:hypothetical protein
MEFRRKKKRGQNKKVQKSWFSEQGYRIIWRKEVYGVPVPARFQACVRTLIPYSDGELRPMWDFVNRDRRLIKTMKAAQEECEKHHRLWTKACEATGVRALKELFGGRLPLGMPLWARKKLDRRLYAILTDNRPAKYRDEEDEPCTESLPPASDAPGPGGPITTLGSPASPTEATSDGPTPASPVERKDKSTTRTTRRTRLKDTQTSGASDTPSTRRAAKGRKKPAARQTRRPSKRAAKRKAISTDSPASGTRRSKGSRKTKSKPSRNPAHE